MEPTGNSVFHFRFIDIKPLLKRSSVPISINVVRSKGSKNEFLFSCPKLLSNLHFSIFGNKKNYHNLKTISNVVFKLDHKFSVQRAPGRCKVNGVT